MTIAVIDYGMGNLRSVARALLEVGARDVVVTDDPAQVAGAERVVFPGQGAVRDCMSALHQHELIDGLSQAIATRPFLGICMGMQALMTRSEENQGVEALGHFAGRVRHFGALTANRTGLKIPHMGWNQVKQSRPHPLWRGIADGERFYFVHSYFVEPEQADITLGTSEYGAEFAAAIGAENVVATQFHPEKSQQPGLMLLKNFLSWDGNGCS